MMKRDDNSIGKLESFSTIIVNIGTIAWWIFSLFTAFVLTSQPQPISLPGVLELGAPYKLIFLISIFLGYIHLLKRIWENQKRNAKDVEGSFGSYLYGSTIKLKRPSVLIGFVSILSIIAVLIFTEILVLAFILVFAVVVGVLSFFAIEGWNVMKRGYDDEYRKRWLKRVKNQLHQEGVAHTAHFVDLPSTTTDEINWAINLYFDLYEFEQDLIFSEKTIRKGLDTHELSEIRFEHIPSRINK
jgi:hypothetical protein